MIGRVAVVFAFRSLLRNPRRTFLSVIGMGIGCSLGLIGTAFFTGEVEMIVRVASLNGTGHVRVVHAGWLDTNENSLRLVDWEAAREAAEAIPGVKITVPRARINGLLAFGNRVAGVEIAGVDPEAEWASNRTVSKSKITGRYLEPGDRDRVVIGLALADRLDVELDDDLLVTLSGRDEVRSAMLNIVGIADTGNRDIDTTICHITLQNLEEITGFEGPGEIAILIEDYRQIDATRKALAATVPPGNTVITWKEANPAMAAGVEGDRASLAFMSFVLVLVVALGIMSAQLTAFLERRREFGVLTALGMKSRQIVGLLFLEAIITGVGGAAVALLLGVPVSYLLSTKGLNIEAILGQSIAMENVLFEPIFYGDFGVWIVWYALVVSLAATIAASLYPAWFAIKMNPAEAMRVT